MFREPFKLVPVANLADIADKFTRNEILSSNEFWEIIGFKPSSDPRANEVRNKNIPANSEYPGDKYETEEILDEFASGKLQVLTSMKCLDEGVDVPRSELAIFCSSTGNPRQFIQRRGRVLRTHPKKKIAVLHDLVVAPEINPNSSSYRMERAMLKSELIRVNNFALLSENPSYSELELREVMEHYGLNLYNNDNIQ